MKKQLSTLTINVMTLALLSSSHIQSVAKQCVATSQRATATLPVINREACHRLWNAARTGDTKEIKQALADGADINGYAQYGRTWLEDHDLDLSTPLQTAVYNRNLHIVTLLLELNAEVDATTNGVTPLLDICGHVSSARPIIRAIATELIAHKADVNALHPYFQQPPLKRAMFTSKDEILARHLILAGADINLVKYIHHKLKKGKIEETPSMRAAVEQALEERAHIETARIASKL